MRAELEKIRSDIEEYFAEREEQGRGDFLDRFDRRCLETARHLYALYHTHREWPQCMGAIFLAAAEAFYFRSRDLRAADQLLSEDAPLRRQSNAVIGEGERTLFAEDFSELNSWAPYFQELGLTQLHLTPSSGDPHACRHLPTWALGSLESGRGFPETLGDLARVLLAKGILLGADFVLNHTAADHFWAKQALEGDPYYRRFYHFYPDRSVPDQVEESLRDLGVDPNPARFTHLDGPGEWVWTTFSPEYWDLDYANPWVFRQMLEEMLALANAGAAVIRVKDSRFLWKDVGTSCLDLPQVNAVLTAVSALTHMAAPGVLVRTADGSGGGLGGEHPMPKGIWSVDWEGFGASLWAALAAGDSRVVGLKLDRFAAEAHARTAACLDTGAGPSWACSHQDMAKLGLNAEVQRRRLADLHTALDKNRFARGDRAASGGENLRGLSVMGSTAALAGLRRTQGEREAENQLAVRRVLLLHSVLLSFGAIPCLRLGDEVGLIGQVSDLSEGDEPSWRFRARYQELVERRHDRGAVEGMIFLRMRYLIQLRKRIAAFMGRELEIYFTGDPAILGYLRGKAGSNVLCLANFSSQEAAVSSDILELSGLGRELTDLVTGEEVRAAADLMLAPYQFVWLSREGDGALSAAAGG
jgi:glycosidase